MEVRKALIKDKRNQNLALLPAAQTRDKSAVSPDQMKVVVQQILDEGYTFVLIDCPAGIEQGFKNATAGANEAIVVINPEMASVRDADRIIGLLEAQDLRNPYLIVNRLRPKMVKSQDMLSVEDVQEVLGSSVKLVGIVPMTKRSSPPPTGANRSPCRTPAPPDRNTAISPAVCAARKSPFPPSMRRKVSCPASASCLAEIKE